MKETPVASTRSTRERTACAKVTSAGYLIFLSPLFAWSRRRKREVTGTRQLYFGTGLGAERAARLKRARRQHGLNLPYGGLAPASSGSAPPAPA